MYRLFWLKCLNRKVCDERSNSHKSTNCQKTAGKWIFNCMKMLLITTLIIIFYAWTTTPVNEQIKISFTFLVEIRCAHVATAEQTLKERHFLHDLFHSLPSPHLCLSQSSSDNVKFSKNGFKANGRDGRLQMVSKEGRAEARRSI